MTSNIKTKMEIDLEEVKRIAQAGGVPMAVAKKRIWKAKMQTRIGELPNKELSELQEILLELLDNV